MSIPLDPALVFVLKDPHKFPYVFPSATPTECGMMSAADKAKLDSIVPGGSEDLQDAYNNGAAGQQLVQYSTANQGIYFNINGAVIVTDTASLGIGDSTKVDGIGAPINYFSITDGGNGPGIKGWFENSVRQIIPIWGGNATTVCDMCFAIPKALAANAAAGNMEMRAQAAADGVANASGGSITLVAGKKGSGASSTAGNIFMGGPGNEDNLTVPYFILNGNTSATGGAAWKVDPADTSAVYQFDTDNDIRTYGNPLMRIGYLNGTRPRVDIYANQTKAMVVTGSSDGAQNGPLWVQTATQFSEKWSGITLDNSTVGGHVITMYTGNFASVGGLTGQTLFRDQTAAKYFLTVYPSGNLQIGDNLNTLVDPGFAVSTLDFYSPRYQGKVTTQNIAGATTITTSTTNGETFLLTGTSNITSLSMLGGVAGQMVTLIFVQDGAGTTTWVNTITNVKLAGGTWTKTTTANAVDVLHLRCTGSNVWYQVAAQATNVS